MSVASTLYVSGINTDNIVAFNTSDGSSSVYFPSGSLNNPFGLDLSPGDDSIYIADSGNNQVIESALPIPSVIETFAAPNGDPYQPIDVLLAPDGSELYVSTFGTTPSTDNQILRYDPTDGSFIGSWTIAGPAGDLAGLAITPDGSTLFVADNLNNLIYQLDTSTGISSVFNTVDTIEDPGFLLYVSEINASGVPEPGSLILLGLSSLGLGLHARRRRSKRQR